MGDLDDEKFKCRESFRNALKCCNNHPEPPSDVNLYECFQLPNTPVSCEREICIATKRGTGKPNGEIILDKLKEEVEKDFSGMAELLEAIKENCLDGNIEIYGTPDMCELKKYRHCMEHQLLATCSDWSQESSCDGIKEKTEKCVKLFES
ncbi:unnamed protein product [Diatraea saccharalis]|uniref:Uncharacterized protein n=1 Tax=Diatraea saccharalis TaxID=40085 RepID=A0A9N9W8J9_9NEOP|nr:unnamed protein product [Diatraea saccharalis]